MDNIILIGFFAVIVTAASFIAYRHYTNEIIKDQERTIENLTAENRRLISALRGASSVTNITFDKSYTPAPRAVIKLDPKDNDLKYGDF